MSLWQILLPEACTNLITNPSIEVDTTGYTAVGGSVARSSTRYRRGSYSLAVTPTSGTADGAYFGTVALTAGTTYTFSVDVYGANGIPYRIYFADTSGNIKGTPVTFTGTGAWARQSVTWACDSSTNYRVYVVKNNSADTTVFYADGWQVEANTHATTYCDGSLALSSYEQQAGFVDDGVAWTGTAHASTSTRAAGSRRGGYWYDLATSFYFYVESALGLGAVPVRVARVEYARPQTAGSLHEHSHEAERIVTLNGVIIGTDLATIHTRRDLLAYYMRVNNDTSTPADEPFLLRYTGFSAPEELMVHYEGGLEGGVLDGFSERVSIRLVADYPYWSASVL